MTLFVSDIANKALLNATYNPLLVALSCLIAIGGSALALHVVTSSARIQNRSTRQAILWLGALIMGLAMTTMHYSGVAATRFIGRAESQEPIAPGDTLYLAAMVAMAVVFMLGLTAIGVLYTKLKGSHTTLKIQSHALQAVSEQAAHGVVTIQSDGKIKSINRSFENMFECTTEDATGQHVTAFIPEWPSLLAQPARHMASETMGKRKNGAEFPIEIKLTHLQSGLLACDVGFITDLSEAQGLQSTLRHEAHYDFLTGLHNRRFMEEQLAIEFNRSDRSGTPLSLLLLDIDHFKDINDAFGHIVGDKVLAMVASMLRMNSRNGDILARHGGEEFLLLLPNTDLSSAMQVATRIRSETEKLTWNKAGKTIRITASLGVTCLQSTFALTPKDLIRLADTALHRAKLGGRNRIEFETPGRTDSDGGAHAQVASSEAPTASDHDPEATRVHA